MNKSRINILTWTYSIGTANIGRSLKNAEQKTKKITRTENRATELTNHLHVSSYTADTPIQNVLKKIVYKGSLVIYA